MTSGTGIDIVSVARIAKLISDRGSLFLERWFTSGEIAYCNGKARPSHHFAARLAAKEAVFKALRSRRDGPVPWLDIEISKDENGAPGVRLRGSVLEAATREGVGTIRVSLSHCEEYATAIAIAEFDEPPAGVSSELALGGESLDQGAARVEPESPGEVLP